MKFSSVFRQVIVVISASLVAACGGDETFSNDQTSLAPQPEAPALVEDTSVDTAEEIELSRAQKLIDMCVAEGASNEVCSCQIKAVAGGLGSKEFTKLVELAEIGDESSAKTMLGEFMLSNPDVAARMSGDMLECAGN